MFGRFIQRHVPALRRTGGSENYTLVSVNINNALRRTGGSEMNGTSTAAIT